jgi:hypothetical protein
MRPVLRTGMRFARSNSRQRKIINLTGRRRAASISQVERHALRAHGNLERSAGKPRRGALAGSGLVGGVGEIAAFAQTRRSASSSAFGLGAGGPHLPIRPESLGPAINRAGLTRTTARGEAALVMSQLHSTRRGTVRTVGRLLFDLVRPWREESAAMSALGEASASPNAQKERMALVVDAARVAVAQEFQIAERLDAKARNQVTVAAAWYGIAQAAAGIVLRSSVHFSGSMRWAIVALAITGAGGFLWLLIASFAVWQVRDEKDVTPRGLAQMAAAAQDPRSDLPGDLVTHYRSILQKRRANNVRRVRWFKLAEVGWLVAVIAALAEVVLVFTVAAHVT